MNLMRSSEVDNGELGIVKLWGCWLEDYPVSTMESMLSLFEAITGHGAHTRLRQIFPLYLKTFQLIM